MPDSGSEPPAPHSIDDVPWRSRLAWTAAVVFVAISAVAIGYGVRGYRTTRQFGDCRSHLQKIGLALHAYHDQFDSFPPAYVLGSDGRPWHSWRVLLLPYLDQQDLYGQYRFDEPWDSLQNLALAAKIPDVYVCPASEGRNRGITAYLAVVGRATAWPEQHTAKISDITDGTSNTLMLVESSGSDILWLEPRDMTHQQAMRFDQPGADPIPSSASHDRERFLVLMADGAVRKINTRISRDVFRSLLSIRGGAPLASVDWPLEAFPSIPELPPPRPASEFPRTDVLPHPAVPLVPGRNCVYCATFEIAWEAACQKAGSRPLQLGGDSPLAQALNAHRFPLSNLASDCYVAGAGSGNAEFRRQLQDEVTSKFRGSVPALIDPDGHDHALQLYAYLLKTLPFQVAFDDLAAPLPFQSGDVRTPVASFGAPQRRDESRSEQLQTQVTILDYVNDDDFVLRLKPGTQRDEIILAKIARHKTLEEGIDAVRRRIAHPDPHHLDQHFLATESLAIPKLTISVNRTYSEIIGQSIVGTNLEFTGAIQIIKFRIDETGAVLESEAVVVGDNGHTPHVPAGRRDFIFDRPFLIYLIERNADQPYFAAWIENTELMESLAK